MSVFILILKFVLLKID